MNNSDAIKHPCLTHNALLGKICEPLGALGVTFFGFTALDQQGNAYCLGSKTDYAKAYLQLKHARNDVHYRPEFKTNRFHYHFWDYAELSRSASSLYGMAAEFGQGHTLTVMRFTENMTRCYHFSGELSDDGLNQRYLEKMDFIHSYIDYFDRCLADVSEIAEIFNHPINAKQSITKGQDQRFIMVEDDPREISLDRVAKKELRFKHLSRYYLTPDERTCLSWLSKGKSGEMIAKIFGVSRKTIERHISSVKRKYDCYTLYQLGEKMCASGLTSFYTQTR